MQTSLPVHSNVTSTPSSSSSSNMGPESFVSESMSAARDLALSSWLWKDIVLAGVAAPESRGVEVPELLVYIEELLEDE
jgi:hypothetical protein